MEEELSTIDIIQDKIKLLPSLEGVVQSNQKRVCDILQQDVSLCHYVFDFIPSDNRLLLQHLDGIALASRLVPTQVYLIGIRKPKGQWQRHH